MKFLGKIVELYLQLGNFFRKFNPYFKQKTKKNIVSTLKMHLITDHVFVIKIYYKNSSYLEVKEAFRGIFLEKDPPSK